MDAIECILTRRSIRKFKGEEVSKDDLDTILRCATYAPSALNRQSYHFNVILNKDWHKRMSKLLSKKTLNPFYNVTYGASVLVVVSDSDSKFASQNGSCALENMMLAAHALNLGSVRINQLSDESLKNDDNFISLLNEASIPVENKIVGCLAIGHPYKDEIEAKPRKHNTVNFY